MGSTINLCSTEWSINNDAYVFGDYKQKGEKSPLFSINTSAKHIKQMEEQWLIDLRNFECEESDSIEIISSCAFPNRKGGKHTEETRKLMSETFSGEGNNFYGKKHTEETRKKMRKAQSKVDRSGKNNPMTKHTPEAKEKMRLAWERRRAIIREKASTSK